MKKLIFLLLAILSIMIVFRVNISAEEKNPWTLKFTDIEGERASCEVYINENEELFIVRGKPKKESSKLLFPLRFVAECFGAKVEWIAETGNIVLDFDTEQWVIYQPKSYNDSFKKNKIFWCKNTIILGNPTDERVGYSDISGNFKGAELVLELINDVNYMDIYGLKSMAKNFRSTVTIDEEKQIVEVFTLPKPFYCGNVFEETKVKVDNGNGDIKEVSALMDGDTIRAISLDGFMTAIGGKSVEYIDEYIEKNEEYLEGFNPEVYRTYKYKDNLFLCSCDKNLYWFNNDTKEGNFSYSIRNVSKDTDENLYVIDQDSDYYYEKMINGNYDGVGCIVNDNIYIFVKNYARNLFRFFGYEYLDSNGECIVRKFSDEFDESLYVIFKKVFR